MTISNDAEKFDSVVRKVLSVSHKEIQKRDKKWKRRQTQKKRANTLPASHASGAKG